jgi:hypothetical protein
MTAPDELVFARAPDAGVRAGVMAAIALVLCAVVGLVEGAYALSVCIILSGGFVVAELWPVRARIGTDGVTFTRHGSSWFIPFADVESLESNDESTELRTVGGRVVKLFNDKQKPLAPKSQAALASLVRRCRRADVQDWPLPPRGTHALPEWLLQTRASPNDIHRGVLLSIAAHPGAPLVHRAAAALLLRSRLSALEAARLGAAADHTASTALCSVLRLAAVPTTTEAQLAEAVEHLDRDPRQGCDRGRLLPLERVLCQAKATFAQSVSAISGPLREASATFEQAVRATAPRLLARLRGR